MYLFVSLCIFMYLPDPGHLDTTYLFVSLGPGGRYKKIHLESFRYDVSFCIFCPASGRYIKIHLDTSWKQDAASPKDSKKKNAGYFFLQGEVFRFQGVRWFHIPTCWFRHCCFFWGVVSVVTCIQDCSPVERRNLPTKPTIFKTCFQ